MSALEHAVSATTTNDSLEAQWHRANTLAGSGDYAAALPLYQKLAEVLPDLADVHCNMGAVLDALGRREEAMQTLRHALVSDPMHALSRRNLAGMLEQAGEYGEAVEHYREAVYLEPERLESVRGLGCALNLAGAHEEARDVLQRALKLAPEDAAAHFYLGNALTALNDHTAALHHMKVAYRLTGNTRAGCNMANLLIDIGELDRAEETLRAVLAAEATYAPAWNSLGGILLRRKDLVGAHRALSKALELEPEFAEAMHGMARCLFKMGDLEAALQRFEAVIARRPDDLSARTELARALQHLGRFKEAEPWHRAILALAPQDAKAWFDLAVTLLRLERWEEARDAVSEALAIDPNFANAFLIHADIQAYHDDLAGAVELANRALENAGGDVSVINATAGLFEQWKAEELAIATYRTALKVEPGNAFAAARLFDLSLSACDWQSYEEDCQRQIDDVEAALRGENGGRGIDVFNLQALPVDYGFISRAARHASAAIAREAREHSPIAMFSHPAPRSGRIRLGYALAYTHFHSLPMVLKEVIERHDRDRFELFGYSLNTCDGTQFSQDYRAAFDHFADVPKSAPYGAAERIHRDGVDVLIDVSGLTGQTCMPLMSFRPAPVQMHAFGYSITTGADYIDYLVTDRTYIPPEWEALGSEALIYMPDTFMPTSRPPIIPGVATRAEHGLPEDAVVFCNFNHPCKFEPKIFAAWMKILRAVPDAVLWFGSWMRNTRQNLMREAQAHGVDGDRLVFARIVEHEDHLRRLALADVALDNYYHGGGVTTLDVLWAGVPLLSVPGIAPGGRLGATLSGAMGVPELVCADLDAYVERAIALARDPAARQSLREKLLRQRDTAPLFDSDRFTRNLERGVAAAWQRHVAGHSPRRIDLSVSGPD